jgi:hypothetical protein
MEDIKNIQEFFSKPLEENVYVEAFKFEKALKGMGYDVKVKYIEDFGKDVFEIYFNNPEDADDDSIFYDAKKLGYDNVRVFANPQESTISEYDVYMPSQEKVDKFFQDNITLGTHYLNRKPVMGQKGSFNKKEIAPWDEADYSNWKTLVTKSLKEEEGYSKYLKTDDNPEGKTKGLTTATLNKILMNVIKDIEETIELGKNLEEGKLCKKGEAYRKRRMAAGEKSSAYLSGRAVKVCKGQMSGKKKK